jgi:nitrate/TMAO reductase-like tetraheme cytochrome c subunit
MKRLTRALRRFFFPPAGASRWVRLAPYATLGLLTVLVLTAGVYTWDYTNSPEFCGTACHTMPPEYTSYLTSPHARIDCVECHIGRGFIAERVSRKAGDLRHVVLNITRRYEFPIRATSMRPARETCERCHFPEKFSDDSLRAIRRFSQDSPNTPTTTYLVMKTGGGSKRLGLGRGIHWHIENPVYYWPGDEHQQAIPYVRVVDDQGQVTEYVDVESGVDVSAIPADELVQMDCITCHNRITHLVLPPGESVDRLMSLARSRRRSRTSAPRRSASWAPTTPRMRQPWRGSLLWKTTTARTSPNSPPRTEPPSPRRSPPYRTPTAPRSFASRSPIGMPTPTTSATTILPVASAATTANT